MNSFHELFQRTKSSRFYDQYLKLAAPLKDLFGINHFWYYRITHSGHYSYVGTHTKWDEFCFGEMSVEDWQECMRIISEPKGLQLMQAYKANNAVIENAFTVALKKFKLHLSLNFSNSTLLGVEGYGFGTYLNDAHADARLLNKLPSLQFFAQNLQKKNKIISQILDANQVDLNAMFGVNYRGPSEHIRFPYNEKQLLRHLGLEPALSLKPRELDILKLTAHGYPASYIAKKIRLSTRTVENYIGNIKSVLSCNSKVQLIQKAQEINASGFFNSPMNLS